MFWTGKEWKATHEEATKSIMSDRMGLTAQEFDAINLPNTDEADNKPAPKVANPKTNNRKQPKQLKQGE